MSRDDVADSLPGVAIAISLVPPLCVVGIGLALSRQMAEHMGGLLTVESNVGEGSRFILWVPTGLEREEREGWIG